MEYQIEEEVAIKEVKEFVAKFNRKTLDEEQIKDLYPDVVDAVKLGALSFIEGEPVFKLTEPILNADKDVSVSEIKFRSRIVPSEQRRISNGLDLKKDGLLFGHKCMAYIIDQPLPMLDKFGINDYKVIEQLSTVFM